MDVSLIDALLGFVMAYSATYVLYCWMHSGSWPQDAKKVSVAALAQRGRRDDRNTLPSA